MGPFAKGAQIRIPVYGYDQVARFLALVEELAAPEVSVGEG